MDYEQLLSRDRKAGVKPQADARAAVGEYLMRARPSRAAVANLAQRLGLSMADLYAMRQEYGHAKTTATKTPAASVAANFRKPAEKISWSGRSMTAKEWAVKLGVSVFQIYDRRKRGKALDGSDITAPSRAAKSKPQAKAKAKTHRRSGPRPKMIDWNGQSKSADGWSKALGIHSTTIRERASRGEPLDGVGPRTKVVAKNPTGNVPSVTWRGETMSLRGWSRKLGIAKSTVRARHLRGQPLDGGAPIATKVHRTPPRAAEKKETTLMPKMPTPTKTNPFKDDLEELSLVAELLSMLGTMPRDRAQRVLKQVSHYISRPEAEKPTVVTETVTSPLDGHSAS